MMVKYTLKGNEILKNGHTMFLEDVVKDLNRKSYLETVECPVYVDPITNCEVHKQRQKEINANT